MIQSKSNDQEILDRLEARFKANMPRHSGLTWEKVQAKLATNSAKLQTLIQMEQTGGEPDVVGQDPETGEYLIYDCAPESPMGRRNGCYDREAQLARKTHPPKQNAVDLATAMGATLLTEAEYIRLQQVGKFDTKSSSWLKTPEAVRELGGALFGDRRYDRVFVYHNGAEAYYAARGFRVGIKV